MPFAGNGGKGVMTPEIFNMLMAEQKSQYDSQAAMLKDLMAFKANQSKEARAVAAEKRAEELHKLELQIKRGQLHDSRKKSQGEMAPDLEAAGIDDSMVQAQRARVLQQNVAPDNLFADPSNLEADPVTGGNFAGVMGQLDPGMVQRDQGQISAADELFRNNPTGTLFDSDLGALAGPGESALDTLQRVGVQGEVGRIADKKKTDAEREKARFDSDLTLGRERQMESVREANRRARRPASVVAYDDEIHKAWRVANDPSNPPEVRERAASHHTALIAERDAEYSRSQPPEAFADRNAKSKKADTYSGLWGTYQALRSAYVTARATGGATIGTQASVTEKIAAVKGFLEDATKLPFGQLYVNTARDQFERAVRDGDTETADRIQREFLDPNVLRDIAKGKLTQTQVIFVAAAINSPHNRLTNQMFETFKENSDYMGFLNPSNLGFATMEANLSNQQGELKRLRQNMERDYPGYYLFDSATGELRSKDPMEATGDLQFESSGGRGAAQQGPAMPPPVLDPVLERMRKNRKK